MLSGFVLTWSGSTRHGVGAFYRNRWARVWPLQIVTLLVVIPMPFKLHDSVRTFLQNVTLTQAWTDDGAHSFNWVSWSISDEAFFYLAFPLAILVLRGRRPRVLALIAVGAVLAQTVIGVGLSRTSLPSFFLTYDFPPYRFFEFLVGICLAGIIRETWSGRGWTRWVYWAGAVYTVLLFGATLLIKVPRWELAIAFVPAVVVFIHWTVRAQGSGRGQWLRVKPLVKLGEWSFALYLVHPLVLRPVAALLGLPAAGYLPLWVGLGVFVVSIALSAVASEWVEKPLERRLRSDHRLTVVQQV